VAMVFTAPYAFHVQISGPEEGQEGPERCNENWEAWKRTVYGVFTNISQFLLPFVTIIICYTAIIRRLGQRAAERPGGSRMSAAREEQERARNQKTNRMLISMVVAFGICWLPLNTINFLNDIDWFPIYCWEFFHFTFFVFHVMAMSSTCYNPFLYFLHNAAFQTEFVKMVPMLKVICGTGSVGGGNGNGGGGNGANGNANEPEGNSGDQDQIPKSVVINNGIQTRANENNCKPKANGNGVNSQQQQQLLPQAKQQHTNDVTMV